MICVYSLPLVDSFLDVPDDLAMPAKMFTDNFRLRYHKVLFI